MPDEPKKPDPIEDLRAGLGLLFRAAKTAAGQIPTDKIEQAMKDSAREVTKALETVGDTIDEKVLGHKKPKPPAAPPGQSASPPPADGAPPNPPPPGNEPPKN